MGIALDPRGSRGSAAALDWLPILAGMAILYIPTFHNLASWHWRNEGSHGPIILAVIAWLVWNQREALLAASARTHPVAGFIALSFGLLLYVVGRSFEIGVLEVGSLLPVCVGLLFAMRGGRALALLWFPIVYMLFLVPLPAFFVDAVTGPLKQGVSDLAERILYAAGYPVSRSGVLLTIGQYHLLVADACAGMHSMFSLSALGLLYQYLVGRKSITHNILMLLSIVPIAFAANVARVLLLMLITYHFGDDAGQGFLHGATGILLFTLALMGFVALDTLLSRVLRSGKHA